MAFVDCTQAPIAYPHALPLPVNRKVLDMQVYSVASARLCTDLTSSTAFLLW